MKRILLALAVCVFLASGAMAGEKVKIGVVRLLEHPDHIAMYEGFIQGMNSLGYEPEVIEVFNADSPANPGTYIQNGQEAAQRMVQNGVQMIFSTAMFHAIKGSVGSVPVVDAAFLSPVQLNNAMEKDGKIYCTGNATGTVLSYPFNDIFQFLRETFKDEKQVAYIFNPDSPVSRPLAEVEGFAGKYGFAVAPCPFKGKDDALAAIEKASKDCKAAFVTNDIAVVGADQAALDYSLAKGQALVFGIIPTVRQGAFAGFQLDWKRAGEMCAGKAKLVLGGVPANTIPIEKSDRYEFGINAKTAEKLGIDSIPYEWLSAATVIVQ